MKAKILLVDDEPDLLEVLGLNLSKEGFVITTAETGAEALAKIRSERPDLILLDIMLEDTSGISLTARLKNTPETADIPVILLTAKDTETDVVVGLSVGADDYITKPFSTAVLSARIDAVLRRAQPPRAGAMHDTLTAGIIKVIPESRQVLVGNKSIDVTGGEYDILVALIQASGAVLSRAELKAALGTSAHGQKKRIVDVHIASLRKKLGRARSIIKTVHSQGYRITTG